MTLNPKIRWCLYLGKKEAKPTFLERKIGNQSLDDPEQKGSEAEPNLDSKNRARKKKLQSELMRAKSGLTQSFWSTWPLLGRTEISVSPEDMAGARWFPAELGGSFLYASQMCRSQAGSPESRGYRDCTQMHPLEEKGFLTIQFCHELELLSSWEHNCNFSCHHQWVWTASVLLTQVVGITLAISYFPQKSAQGKECVNNWKIISGALNSGVACFLFHLCLNWPCCFLLNEE